MNRLRQWIVFATATSIVLLVETQAAWACAVCFGAPDDPQTRGMNMAIITMLSVTGIVMAFIISVGVMVWRRTLEFNALHDAEEGGSAPVLPDETVDA